MEAAGRPLAAWCIAALAEAPSVKRLVVAAPPGGERELEDLARETAPQLPVDVVEGGSSRSESVARALARAPDADAVLVHDAARPLITAELVERCVAQLGRLGSDGVVAAARASDTIKEADSGGRVIATLDRRALWIVQTPQVFRASALRDALERGELDRAFDDAQLVEAAGGDIRVVESPRDNLKVTTPFDLTVAELLLEARC